jgi:hypothetical protein
MSFIGKLGLHVYNIKVYIYIFNLLGDMLYIIPLLKIIIGSVGHIRWTPIDPKIQL